jgi:hypothetical protein
MVPARTVPSIASEKISPMEARDGYGDKGFKNLRWQDIVAYAVGIGQCD